MTDFSNVTFCVVDNRWFLQLALKLAESGARVLYYSPYEEDLPHIELGVVGDGYENIERCNDFWKVKNEVDCFVFPDLFHSGAQIELEAQGYPVWGSRNGEIYELSRDRFLQALLDLKLPIAPHVRVVGLTSLKSEIIKRNKPCWVKISKWRGTLETSKVDSFEQAQPIFARIETRFGPLAEQVPFFVFDPVESIVELGGDFYCIDGRIPTRPLHGIEKKGRGYIGGFQDYREFPEPVQKTMDAFLPLLSRERYRNFFSMEILQTESGDWFPIDPCCRCPNPALGSQLELYGNLPEIILAGAHGEFIEPDRIYEFSVECALTVKEGNQWNVFDVPKEARQWCKIPKSCEVDGLICATPRDYNTVGMLVGVGNTIKKAIEHAQSTAELIKDTPLEVEIMDLAKVLEQIESEEEAGIDFTKKTVPEPSEAIRKT